MNKRRATEKTLAKKYLGKWVRWVGDFESFEVFKVTRVERATKASKFPCGWLWGSSKFIGYAAKFATILTEEEAAAYQL